MCPRGAFRRTGVVFSYRQAILDALQNQNGVVESTASGGSTGRVGERAVAFSSDWCRAFTRLSGSRFSRSACFVLRRRSRTGR